MKEEINEENQHSQFKQKDHSFWINKKKQAEKTATISIQIKYFFSLISYLQH